MLLAALILAAGACGRVDRAFVRLACEACDRATVTLPMTSKVAVRNFRLAIRSGDAVLRALQGGVEVPGSRSVLNPLGAEGTGSADLPGLTPDRTYTVDAFLTDAKDVPIDPPARARFALRTR